MNEINELSRAFPDLVKTAMGFASQHIIAAATVQTYIVATYHLPPGGKCACRSIDVVQAHSQPEPSECIPEGSEFIRADVWPVERLRTLPLHQCGFGLGNLWRAYLLWCRAQDLGKEVSDMRPWEDYDPITIDTDVSSWVNGRRVAA